MDNHTQKIFITGASGFLGSYVIRTLLDQGYTHIIGLKRPTSNLDMLGDAVNKVKWVDGDILDVPMIFDALIGVDVVIHTAAIVTFDPSFKKEMQKVNIEGTSNMVHASLANGIKRFVHVSSIAAIGRSKMVSLVDEKTSWSKSKYNTFYGVTKHHAELEVWKGHAEGLESVIVNPSFIVGAGDWSSSTCSLFGKIYDGFSHYPIGTNGIVDVRDVAIGIVRAMERQVTGHRFILSAENLSYKEFLGKIARAIDVKAPEKPMNKFIQALAWRWEWIRTLVSGKTPLLTKESVKSTSTTTTYDNQKSKELLGLQYHPVDAVIDEAAAAFILDMKLKRRASILPLH